MVLARSVVTVAGKRYGLRRMVGQVCWSVAKSAERLAGGCGHMGSWAVLDVRTSWRYCRWSTVSMGYQQRLLASVSCIELEALV